MIGRAVLGWLCIIAVETVLGTLRVFFLEPALGEQIAGTAGFVAALIVIYVVAWFTIPWIAPPNSRICLSIGLLWAALTFGFEIVLGHLRGFGWERILRDYDPARGAPMAFGLLLLALAPLIAWQLRRGWTRTRS